MAIAVSRPDSYHQTGKFRHTPRFNLSSPRQIKREDLSKHLKMGADVDPNDPIANLFAPVDPRNINSGSIIGNLLQRHGVPPQLRQEGITDVNSAYEYLKQNPNDAYSFYTQPGNFPVSARNPQVTSSASTSPEGAEQAQQNIDNTLASEASDRAAYGVGAGVPGAVGRVNQLDQRFSAPISHQSDIAYSTTAQRGPNPVQDAFSLQNLEGETPWGAGIEAATSMPAMSHVPGLNRNPFISQGWGDWAANRVAPAAMSLGYGSLLNRTLQSGGVPAWLSAADKMPAGVNNVGGVAAKAGQGVLNTLARPFQLATAPGAAGSKVFPWAARAAQATGLSRLAPAAESTLGKGMGMAGRVVGRVAAPLFVANAARQLYHGLGDAYGSDEQRGQYANDVNSEILAGQNRSTLGGVGHTFGNILNAPIDARPLGLQVAGGVAGGDYRQMIRDNAAASDERFDTKNDVYGTLRGMTPGFEKSFPSRVQEMAEQAGKQRENDVALYDINHKPFNVGSSLQRELRSGQLPGIDANTPANVRENYVQFARDYGDQYAGQKLFGPEGNDFRAAVAQGYKAQPNPYINYTDDPQPAATPSTPHPVPPPHANHTLPGAPPVQQLPPHANRTLPGAGVPGLPQMPAVKAGTPAMPTPGVRGVGPVGMAAPVAPKMPWAQPNALSKMSEVIRKTAADAATPAPQSVSTQPVMTPPVKPAPSPAATSASATPQPGNANNIAKPAPVVTAGTGPLSTSAGAPVTSQQPAAPAPVQQTAAVTPPQPSAAAPTTNMSPFAQAEARGEFPTPSAGELALNSLKSGVGFLGQGADWLGSKALHTVGIGSGSAPAPTFSPFSDAQQQQLLSHGLDLMANNQNMTPEQAQKNLSDMSRWSGIAPDKLVQMEKQFIEPKVDAAGQQMQQQMEANWKDPNSGGWMDYIKSNPWLLSIPVAIAGAVMGGNTGMILSALAAAGGAAGLYQRYQGLQDPKFHQYLTQRIAGAPADPSQDKLYSNQMKDLSMLSSQHVINLPAMLKQHVDTMLTNFNQGVAPTTPAQPAPAAGAPQ